MEDTQVNKTHRHTDIQTGRDLTLPLTSVSVSHDKNHKQKQDSNREKEA